MTFTQLERYVISEVESLHVKFDSEIEKLHVKIDVSFQKLSVQMETTNSKLDTLEAIVSAHDAQLVAILDWMQLIGNALGVHLPQKRKQ